MEVTLYNWRERGYVIEFPYHPDHVQQIKVVLGATWVPSMKRWVIEGPEALIDMKRFGIQYRPADAETEARLRGFETQLARIVEIQAHPFGDPDAKFGYQVPGVEGLRVMQRGVLGDDMGLGKTKQSLDAARLEGAQAVLVITNKTLVYNWLPEIQKWWPEAQALIVEKNTDLSKADRLPVVVVTNYEKLIQANEPYTQVGWDTIIFDEATRVKNKRTRLHQQMLILAEKAQRVWPLTGTPIEMAPHEFHGITAISNPALFGNYGRFAEHHVDLDEDGKVRAIKNLGLLQDRIRPWMMRRLKSEVLTQLPPKQYAEMFIDLDPWERAEYKKIVAQFKKWLAENRLGNSATRLTQMLRQQQFTSSPALLIDGAPRGSKFGALEDCLAEWQGQAIVFTRFREMSLKLVEWLELDPDAIIHGDVKAKDRQDRIDRFNAGTLGKVLICTDAAAHGLNITSADLVIHYDKLWNPAKEAQREDRIHRIGQEHQAYVLHMIAKDTLDHGMHLVTQHRQKIAQSIDGRDEIAIQRFTQAQLLAMAQGKEISVG